MKAVYEMRIFGYIALCLTEMRLTYSPHMSRSRGQSQAAQVSLKAQTLSLFGLNQACETVSNPRVRA